VGWGHLYFIAQYTRSTSAATRALKNLLLRCILFLHGYQTHCLSVSALGLIVYLGMMVGAVMLGGLADKLGRKKCLIISLAINAAFAFLSSFVQGYGFFLFCRLISGLGWVTGESVPCPGGVLSQRGSLAVRGGRRKAALEMHLWYRARTALLLSTCSCITSRLTLKALAVRKFSH